MQRIRLPIAIVGSLQAAAPTFTEVPGSYLPITAGKVDANGILSGVLLSDPILAQVTVLVDVPDDDCTNGKLDPAKVATNYPKHPLILSGAIK